MTKEIKDYLEAQNWKSITRELVIYAHYRLKFWGLLDAVGIRGNSPKDIALEAICLVYSGERVWNPQRGDLIKYLKFNVVRGLVANLAKRKETQEYKDDPDADGIAEYNTVDEVNAKLICDQIREELKDEPVLLTIFNDLYDGMKRGDICELRNLSPDDYDNATRRLKTKVTRFKKLIVK